jgi:hypothetical protein
MTAQRTCSPGTMSSGGMASQSPTEESTSSVSHATLHTTLHIIREYTTLRHRQEKENPGAAERTVLQRARRAAQRVGRVVVDLTEARPVVGRGHVSLFANLDTWHSNPLRNIGHLLTYYQRTDRRQPTACTSACRESSKCACRHARTSSGHTRGVFSKAPRLHGSTKGDRRAG